jgi:hypothetical protein
MQPVDCLLLLAVPLDETEFRAAWAHGSDFLSVYSDVESGWSAYAAAATFARGLVAECAALGATVVRRATLRDLHCGAMRFQTVAVVAHMASPPVSPADVLDADALEHLVATGDALEWWLVRTERGDGRGTAESIAAVNRLLEGTYRELNASPTGDVRDGERAARHRRPGIGLLRLDRPRLDELCGPAVLRPGPCVETAEGMTSAAEFVAAIPESYSGFLDLRMCNSIALGAAVRRARPALSVGVGRRTAELDSAVFLYKTALLCMAHADAAGRPISYQEAMMTISEATR